MVHLFNASLADRAMVGPLRFYTAALRTFEYYLTLLKAHELNILFGRISPRHSTWVRQHCPDMGAQGEKCQGLKNNAVHYCKYFVRVGVEDHSKNHESIKTLCLCTFFKHINRTLHRILTAK